MSFSFLGNCTLPLSAYDKMVKEAMDFILACYNMRHYQNLTQAQQEVWNAKMAKSIAEPPKLYSLPPTSEAFAENANRAYLQLAIWLHALDPDPPNLDPTIHGWTHVTDATSSITPTIIPIGTLLAHGELLNLIKCGCTSLTRACKSGKCSCVSSGLAYTLFCTCKGVEGCQNKFAK